MTHVEHAASGWRVAATGRVHGTLRAALDDAREALGGAKAPFLRDPDTGELSAEWRWLPATEEEPEAIGGVRIDAVAIAEMACSLNERTTPIPVDGGPAPMGMLASEVHGTASTGGGTPANGWAHSAVSVRGSDGVVELYLWAELIPSVARESDAGRLAMGSVHFGCSSIEGEDSPRGCVLISHALTNSPAVTTLAPANSVRVDGREIHSARRSRAHAGLVLRTTNAPGARGEYMSDEEKKDEKKEEQKSRRALVREEGAEGDAYAAADMLAEAVSDAPTEHTPPADATVAEVMEMAAQTIEELTAKVEAQPEAPAETEASEGARALTEAVERATRLGKELAEMQRRLQPLEAEKAIRDRETAVDELLAKRSHSPKLRAEVLEHAERFGVEAARKLVSALALPPAGSPVPRNIGASRIVDHPERDHDDLERVNRILPEIRSQFPNDPAHHQFARALKRVREGR